MEMIENDGLENESELEFEAYRYFRKQAGCWDKYLGNKLEVMANGDFRDEKYFLKGLDGLRNYLIKNKHVNGTIQSYYRIYLTLKEDHNGMQTLK